MKQLGQVVSTFSGASLKEVKVSQHLKTILVPLWREILGKLATEFTFEHVRYRQLYMSTSNPIWKVEIKYHEPLITQRLNDRLPKSLHFKGIRVFYRQSCVSDDIDNDMGKPQTEATPCCDCGVISCLADRCLFCRLK